ncbi:MAG TPA: adenylate/guanylate cyclase domain-containing protein [Stellaceae bacterium]|nr:adenylate/guanylate cyclase domain-containing protein [Stellaceae bacterium]
MGINEFAVIGMDDVHLRRRLTAVLLADVVGYSRLMNADEEGTHVRLAERVRTLIEPAVAQHHGRPVRSMGDGMLVEFDSAVNAVRCAIDIQRGLAARESEDNERRIQLRIGINTGDVIVDERDIYGNSINIAARLEGLAKPGQIYVTRSVRDQLRGYPDISFEDKGEHWVKNIDRPIRVFRAGYDEKPRAKSPLQSVAALLRRPILPRNSRAASLAAGALLAALAILGMTVPPGWFNTAAVPPRASIVVMPFNNFSGDSNQDYFADAVTDDLTTDLSRIPGVLVIASSTAFTYKGKAVDVRQVGRECNVRYVLEGSINKIGNLIHTNARLVEAASGAQIWSERFEKKFANLSELQDIITGRIASSLEIQLVKAEIRAVAPSSADPDATDLRLRAMALLLSPITHEHHLAARRYLEESLRLGPESAEAWGQLANLMMNDYYNHWLRPGEKLKDLLREAEKAVRNALRLDPTVAIAHVAEGMVLRAHGDHLGALDAFDRAVQLDPNLARAWAQKANELVMVGRPEEAPALALRAITLSPRDPALPVYYWHIGRAYFVMKKYGDAIVWIRKSVGLRDNAWYTWAYLVSAYALTRQSGPEVDEAIKNFKTKFKEYTIETIQRVYEKENPQRHERMKESIQELTKGLREAGIPEH